MPSRRRRHPHRPRAPNLHHNPRHHQRHRARAGADEPESTTFLSEAAHRQLRLLSLDERRSGQKLIIEALNDLFRKYGRPPIAD